MCGCKKTVAPRPYPVQVPRLNLPVFKSICKEQAPAQPKPFNPIGDVCNCGQQIVKPAPLPNNRLNVSLESCFSNFNLHEILFSVFKISFRKSIFQELNLDLSAIVDDQAITPKNTLKDVATRSELQNNIKASLKTVQQFISKPLRRLLRKFKFSRFHVQLGQ